MSNKIIIQPGQKFNRWTVIQFHSHADGGGKWLCRCECGTEKVVDIRPLRRGHSQSCGCFNRELCLQRFTTHGMTHSTEYHIFHSMHRRCEDPKNDSYQFYGARGITVCNRWTDFSIFLSDVGLRPSPEYSLERVDSTKGYSPENVVWATAHEQARNRRSNRYVTINNETRVLEDWAGFAVSLSCIRYRLNRNWSVEDAITVLPGMRPQAKASTASD